MECSLILETPGFFWCSQFKVEWKASLPSTQSFLLERAQDEPSGAVVVAEVQTAGMGRKGRAWVSSSSKGLWMSVLLKQSFEGRRVFLLPFWFAMALTSTLESMGIHGVSPIWPNDIYLEGRKLAGILVDTTIQGGGLETAVIGVGLNLNQTGEEFPGGIKDTAISLRMVTGKEWSQKDLLRRFLWSLPETWRYLEREGDTAFLEAYWQLSKEATSKFAFSSSGRKAKAIGIDPSGGLCLKGDDGAVFVVQDVQDIVKIGAGR